MKKLLPALLGFGLLASAFTANAQIAFTTATDRFSDQTVYSGCPTTIVDWNNDGMDDVIRLDQGRYLYVEIQRPGQTFESRYFGDMGGSNGWAWAMAVGDVDDNGYVDVFAGGYGPAVKLAKMNATGTTATISNLPSSNFFLQNISMGDINEDGYLDIFCCDDNAESHIYLNNGTGTFTASTIIDFDVTTTDDSGNYGSVWTDYDNDGDLDLYIAKCRQSVSNPADGRRINVMFRNNGNGTFTEAAAASNINVGWQSWTASFGDMDNDGDFDLALCNHDGVSQIWENDGLGVYTDITSSTGFTTSGMTPIECVFEDLDNDGFADIFITGSTHRVFKNNGDNTFSTVSGLFNGNDMESFSTGDANHDGFIDIYASYADIYTTPSTTKDELWLNNKNSNHYFNLDLRGTVSNSDAVGARAYIYGAWGVQTREVRIGESYGTVNSSMLHFGLGSATSIDSVVINWPMGGTQTIYNPAVDQFLTVIESTCVGPTATVTAQSGSFIICSTGTPLVLEAPAGYTYVWSTGETTQTISVTTAGEYNVTILQSGNICPGVSPVVEVTVAPDETPAISASGETEVCYGETVTLQGPSGASSYSWSNGETTQDITVTQSGSYTLTIQGTCAPFTSAPIAVTVNAAPTPVTTDATTPVAASVALTATGTNITWYDAATGGNIVGTGNTYNTPVLSTTTTYYAEDAASFGGGSANGGMLAHSGSSLYAADATNATMTFDVTQACTLTTVKVYTDTPGDRLIEVKNSGGTVVNSALVTIASGTSNITLNFALTPGTGYTISTNSATNTANLGFAGPRLQRNSTGVAYPYNIGSAISLTTSSAGGNYYYYFYDWNITMAPVTCPGEREPATAFVTIGINEITTDGFSIYPNPANEVINVRPTSVTSTYGIEIIDVTGRIILTDKNVSGLTTLNVNQFNAGVYFIRLTVGDKTTTQRIVIQ
jgi:hypothetical protein